MSESSPSTKAIRDWCRQKYGNDWWQENKPARKKEARAALTKDVSESSFPVSSHAIPAAAATATHNSQPLGRRRRRNPNQVARRLNPAELDRVGYGIPFIRGPKMSDLLESLFQKHHIKTRRDLDTRYPTRTHLYNIVRDSCHDHWYSHEQLFSAQTCVEHIIRSQLGLKSS